MKPNLDPIWNVFHIINSYQISLKTVAQDLYQWPLRTATQGSRRMSPGNSEFSVFIIGSKTAKLRETRKPYTRKIKVDNYNSLSL